MFNKLYKIKSRSSVNNGAGFTLIELLIVISIIGILASIVLNSLNTARENAKIAKATSELRNVRSAIAMLENDTGKWPNGCPPNIISNPEVELDNAQAGIKVQPAVQDNGDGCEWVAEDIVNWDGPYMETPIDPWGTSYWFDPDYTPYDNCVTIPDEAQVIVLVSFGPNKVGVNAYDCDDVFVKIQ